MISLGDYSFLVDSASVVETKHLSIELLTHDKDMHSLHMIEKLSYYCVLYGYTTLNYGDGEVIEINSGTSALLSTGQYLFTERVNRDNNPFLAVLISIKPEFIKNLFIQYSQALDFRIGAVPPTNPEVLALPFSPLSYSGLVSFISYFQYENCMAEITLPLKVSELIFIFLSTLKREQASKYLYMLHNYNSNHNSRFQDVISANICRNIRIEELASMSCMSPTTFKSKFNKLYGMSPRRWINQQRIIKAATLLKVTKNSVSEVGYAVGFENLSYFIKLFKNFYGVTPKEYSTMTRCSDFLSK